MHAPKSKPRLMLPVSRRDHIQGDLTAAITLVEYGDFECPHCAAGARDSQFSRSLKEGATSNGN